MAIWCFYRNTFCYGPIKPVKADDNWTQSVGQRRGELFTTDESERQLPAVTISDNKKTISVQNEKWVLTDEFLYSIMNTQRYYLEHCESLKDTIKNNIQYAKNLIGDDYV